SSSRRSWSSHTITPSIVVRSSTTSGWKTARWSRATCWNRTNQRRSEHLLALRQRPPQRLDASIWPWRRWAGAQLLTHEQLDDGGGGTPEVIGEDVSSQDWARSSRAGSARFVARHTRLITAGDHRVNLGAMGCHPNALR